ncbi:TPA: ribbon-helix-helix protein, CopG family [Enterococcus faecium]|nr:ribbon-helix-helix protein, CopG family [Enterococcus faecium]
MTVSKEKKRIQITISREMIEMLDQYAKRDGMTKSEIVEEVLNKYVKSGIFKRLGK